jgi:hypothetical protein
MDDEPKGPAPERNGAAAEQRDRATNEPSADTAAAGGSAVSSTSPPELPESGAAADSSSATPGSSAPELDFSWVLTRARNRREQPPVRWREILSVLLLIVVCDLTIYRGEGFAGLALLFVAAPVLLLVGAPRPIRRSSFWIVGIMLLALAAKMVWCGSALLVACGFALIVAFAMALSGLCPYVLEVGVFASQTILAGYDGLIHYRRSSNKLSPPVRRGTWLNVALPVAAFVAFGLLFILANPDLLTRFGEKLELFFNTVRDWIIRFAPDVTEILFWIAVLWTAVGLLRPVITETLFQEAAGDVPPRGDVDAEPAEAVFYAPFRNTLITVAVLFAVYLVFEFVTLWFREFPEGFYYSGYAHEGAAWLTVALGLATVVLSLIFRGRVLGEPRLPTLRKLAWIWSLENVLLAVAVYHRLYIYIGFNGMTRMRTVGIFGISCVLVGFLLVVWKIVYNRDFIWLMRRHLWALAVTVYLFALTPVDTAVHSYNVRRILSGDPAPSVQISVHPISSEGVLLLRPLLDCQDEIIREGVRAMLAQRREEAGALAQRRQALGWTAFQIADRVVLDGLRRSSPRWAEYADRRKRSEALERFHEYAYQWY